MREARTPCALALLGVLAALWTVLVWLSNGFELSIGPLQLTSNDPTRPLVITLLAMVAYLVAAGPARAREDAARLAAALTPGRLAAAITAAILIIGIANNSWGAGASDSYTYVSQMELLRAGNLKVPIAMADDVPWPNPLATFTPFGYAAVANQNAIAPITGPGLPLLMAAFKVVAGQTAAFLVVPLTRALLVWTTFLLGRRVHSDAVGLAAAWLVATSPTFLMMFKTLMSDVPAAAFWALAVYAAVILVRMFMGNRRRAALFVAAAGPGALAVAAINASLFGSPLSSGYGDLASLFSRDHIPGTLGAYTRWLVETQTPLVLAGVYVLRIAPLLGSVLVAVWILYAAYPTFDACGF